MTPTELLVRVEQLLGPHVYRCAHLHLLLGVWVRDVREDQRADFDEALRHLFLRGLFGAVGAKCRTIKNEKPAECAPAWS